MGLHFHLLSVNLKWTLKEKQVLKARTLAPSLLPLLRVGRLLTKAERWRRRPSTTVTADADVA